jgi:hypothetical protein
MCKSILILTGLREEREIHWKMMKEKKGSRYIVMILTTKLTKFSIKGFYLITEVR